MNLLNKETKSPSLPQNEPHAPSILKVKVHKIKAAEAHVKVDAHQDTQKPTWYNYLS